MLFHAHAHFHVSPCYLQVCLGRIMHVQQNMVKLTETIYSFIVNRYGCRVACIFGSTLCLLGLVLSAFAVKTVWQLALTYGVGLGLGLGIINFAGMVIVPIYFEKVCKFIACNNEELLLT